MMNDELSNAFQIELEQEDDGRWIADIPALTGVIVYGETKQQAISLVQALALRVIADKLEHGEINLGLQSLAFIAA